MTRLARLLGGDGLLARALRSSAWTVFGFGASQTVRLAANLLLTRLLFPEAFGLMALVTVILVGLTNFSDVGTGPAILQSRRGDERAFLDTAWTIQVVRGLCLWLLACALAWPVAAFYDAPMLAAILPVAGLSLVIGGFSPTRLDTANRHLALGRVIRVDLASQLAGIVLMVLAAWATGSVWALVAGGLATAAARLVLAHRMLPGAPDRFRWEPAAAAELLRFGRWIFLSTACGFVVAQGDRLILGKYFTLEQLGVYNIGYFLASVPLHLAGAVVWRILIPLHRERPPAASRDNYAKIRRMRLALSGLSLTLLLGLAFAGVPLVGLLYDPRYADAGAILVVIACVLVPQVVGMTYDQAALAAGDSRGYFLLIGAKAVLQTAAFVAGAEAAGLLGALAGQGLALLAVYPLVIRLARRHGAWDPLHDAAALGLGLGLGALALWLNADAVAALAPLGR